MADDRVPCFDLYPIQGTEIRVPPGMVYEGPTGVFHCPGDWYLVEAVVGYANKTWKVAVAINRGGFTIPSGSKLSASIDNPTVEYCLYPNSPPSAPVVKDETVDSANVLSEWVEVKVKEEGGGDVSVQIDPYRLDYNTKVGSDWVGPVGLENPAPGPGKASYFDRVNVAMVVRMCRCELARFTTTEFGDVRYIDPHPSWICIVDTELAKEHVDPERWVEGFNDRIFGASILAYDMVFSITGEAEVGKPPGLYVEPGAAVVYDGANRFRMGVEWAQITTVLAGEEAPESGWLEAKLKYLDALRDVPCSDELATSAARYLLNADDLFSGLIGRLREKVKEWSQADVDSFWERLSARLSAMVPGSVPEPTVEQGGSLDYLVAAARVADPVSYTYAWEAGAYFVIAVVGHRDSTDRYWDLQNPDIVAGCKIWGIKPDPDEVGDENKSRMLMAVYKNPDPDLGAWLVDSLPPDRLADVVLGLVAAEGASLAILWKYAAAGNYTVKVFNPSPSNVSAEHSVSGVDGAVVKASLSPVRDGRFYWPWEADGLVQVSEVETVALQAYDPPSYTMQDGRKVVGPLARILQIGEAIGEVAGAGIVAGWGAGVV